MKYPAVLLLVSVLVSPLASFAAERPAHFASLDVPEIKTIIPAPPPAGSLAALADLETVLQAQAARTPNDVAWAKFIEHDSFFQNASVLGPWFTKENLPGLTDFMKSVSEDVARISSRAKDLYPRARPPFTDQAVHPCVEIPASNSYPSGHTLRAFVWAAVLGDIFPDERDALLAHAHQAGWARVIGGAHFPSDVVGGRLLAAAIVAEMRKSPAYQAGVEKCRAEAAAAMRQKAA